MPFSTVGKMGDGGLKTSSFKRPPRSTTESKRQRRDIAEAIPTPNTPDAAMALIRDLMKQFSVDPAMLEDDDSGLSLSSLFWNLVW